MRKHIAGRVLHYGSVRWNPSPVHRRCGSVFWRSWARVIRGRLPAIGRPNDEILHHGPPPAYARGQTAVGGAEPWPRMHPGVLRGLLAAAGL